MASVGSMSLLHIHLVWHTYVPGKVGISIIAGCIRCMSCSQRHTQFGGQIPYTTVAMSRMYSVCVYTELELMVHNVFGL